MECLHGEGFARTSRRAAALLGLGTGSPALGLPDGTMKHRLLCPTSARSAVRISHCAPALRIENLSSGAGSWGLARERDLKSDQADLGPTGKVALKTRING